MGQEEILFNKDDDNNDNWNMNELTLGMYLYRIMSSSGSSTNDNKRLNAFNPYEYNNLQKWKDTIIHHTTTTTNSSENDITQQRYHIFWNEFKNYILPKEEKSTTVLKFIFQDILQTIVTKNNITSFGLYILQEYLPLCGSTVMEDILTKDIMKHLCMNV